MSILFKNGLKYTGSANEAIDDIRLSTSIKQSCYESNFGLPETPGPEIEYEDFLFSKNINAPSETILSNALPIPNSKAIPVSVGVHTLAMYRINAIP